MMSRSKALSEEVGSEAGVVSYSEEIPDKCHGESSYRKSHNKGNVKVFCRMRPPLKQEVPCVMEFPNGHTISISDGPPSNSMKDFEFDKVFGPYCGQFGIVDAQPFVQSAYDGDNVSILAFGQTNSGKTYTMEGRSGDNGLYFQCFEMLFDLSNSDSNPTSRVNFSFTVIELHNEEIRDLVALSGKGSAEIEMRLPGSTLKLVSQNVNNPKDYSRLLKTVLRKRKTDESMFNVSHLIVTIHMNINKAVSGKKKYSKLSLVDLAGSESLMLDNNSGDCGTDNLHAMQSLSALGDVLSSLTSKSDPVPYEKSLLTKVLSDSLGGNSKTLMIVNLCPDVSNLSSTFSSLNFASRACNSVLRLGKTDTTKNWGDLERCIMKTPTELENPTSPKIEPPSNLHDVVRSDVDPHPPFQYKAHRLGDVNSDDDEELNSNCCKHCSKQEVYCIVVTGNSCEETKCKSWLKDIGCESGFIRLSRREPFVFYAMLDKREAEMLEENDEIFDVLPKSSIIISDD